MSFDFQLMEQAAAGDFRALARILTLVENDLPQAADLLMNLKVNAHVPVIGITGPPGAGKSTLVNALINQMDKEGKRVAVIAVDPTSPFNFGSLLGDRVRMAENFNKENIFIRSIATRGSLGGLSAKTIELVDVLRSARFDYILIETAGVGQSEVEIAGLADITLVVLVPESGDEIQGMKSGLMEIADAFVVNKADRDGADHFAAGLKKLIHQSPRQIPVFKTAADKKQGIEELAKFLYTPKAGNNERKQYLLTEKAYRLIQAGRMADIKREQLQSEIAEAVQKGDFNLYRFVSQIISSNRL